MQILVGPQGSNTLTWEQVMELARAAAVSAKRGSFTSGSTLPPSPPSPPPPKQPGQSLVGPEDLQMVKEMPQPNTFYNNPSEGFKERYMAGARRSTNVTWSDDAENNPPAIDNMEAISNRLKFDKSVAQQKARGPAAIPPPITPEAQFFMPVPPMAPSLFERPPMFKPKDRS